MTVTYQGLIKKNSTKQKVLVTSNAGRYYVWTASQDEVDALRNVKSGEVSNAELELANERQVEVGRGSVWVPNASNILVQVEFCGIISGGRNNTMILVKQLNDIESFYTAKVDAVVANSLLSGDVVSVDMRTIQRARNDHIAAGLGLGTLERVKKHDDVHVL